MAGTRLARPKKANAVNRYGIRYHKSPYLRLLEEVKRNRDRMTEGKSRKKRIG